MLNVEHPHKHINLKVNTLNSSKLKRMLKSVAAVERNIAACVTQLAALRSDLENDLAAGQAIGNAAKPDVQVVKTPSSKKTKPDAKAERPAKAKVAVKVVKVVKAVKRGVKTAKPAPTAKPAHAQRKAAKATTAAK